MYDANPTENTELSMVYDALELHIACYALEVPVSI